jgi:hypothetical protein
VFEWKGTFFFVAKMLLLYIFRNKHDKLMKILDATFDPCVGDELFLIEKIKICTYVSMSL